jgi:fimbrial isopeptide formation D2 family protein/uncharacterized repeat protein (TIGR01451 family)
LLTVLAAPQATQAQVCANAGKDGPGGTLSGVINTYYPGAASASAGSTSISIGTPVGSATAIASGDLLLVIQMQDAAINSTNSDSYGDGVGGAPASGWTSLNSAGLYEYVVATSAAGATVSIRGAGSGNGLVNSYSNAAASGTQGQRRFQVVRVPQYSSATLGSGLTALAWNGATGGILALDVTGALALGSATVNLNGMGFRGAGARQLAGGSGGTSTDYVNVSTNNFHGNKGEGIAGTPRYVYDGPTDTVVNTGAEGYPNGSTARGAPGNAGGGGSDTDIAANQENSGGGGGSNWGAGGLGGKTWQSNQDRGGYGGAAFTSAAGNRVIMGGGGGSGTRNNSSGTMSSGAAGGGIVMVRAGTISGSATISVNGSDGKDADNDGGGGGGAGGSVVVLANSGGIGSLTVNARGGSGGDAWITQAPNGTPGERHGPGGGGGGGFVAVSGSASTNVTGGANGLTTTALDAYGATAGSTGSVITIVSSDMPGASSGAQCVPVLTTSKSTSTSTVTNTATGTTATYSIVVSNAANRSSANNLNISDTLPSGFTFNSTVSVTLAGGATRPSTTNPTVGDAVPNWGVFTIPGAGSVTLNFTARIASTVANGTYQNPATATYQDPTRTVAGGTMTSSYSSGSSTAEDVTVNSADLTIAKTHTGNFSQGQTGATYSIAVTNSGNGPTSGTVTVTDTLPTGLTATAISGTGWGCVLGTLTCTRSDVLAAGASYPVITLTVTVANNAPSSVTNSVAVSGGSEINTANDTATNPTTINQLADLTISKSHIGNFQQGQTGATYSITVTNSGAAATSGTVTVTDTLPTGLTATAISGTGWSCVLGTLTCTRSDALAASASYPVITVTVDVADNAASSVINSVSVSGGGESNTANDTDTDATTVTQMPDLTVNKSHSGNFSQGQTGATYSIVVTNSGFATTSGTVTVTDTLPTGLTATAISGTGWTCTLATLTCTRNTTRGAGASFPTITVTVNVAANAPASVTNSVTVSGGGETNTSNDTDSDPTTVVQPDLTIAKSHSGNFTQGQTGAQYSITVTNSGTASTNGSTVTVTETLPTGLTATAISGTGWTCVLGTLTCTRTTVLTAGSSYPAITLTVNVANNAPASVTNSVAVSGGGETNTANNTGTDPTTVNQFADLTVAKSHPGNFSQGQTGATYSITVTNSGLAATTAAVSVTDTLPSGLTATAISGTGWSCVLGTLTCTRSDVLAGGASYPAITVTVNVANNAASSVTNSVAVSGGGELVTTNNSASDPTTVTQLPDMTISKSHSGNFTQGQVGATYSITARNSGFASTSGTVTVTDTLPTGLTATAISGTGWTCVLATLTCTRSDALAASTNYPVITVTVNVANNAASSVTNSVNVSGGGQTNTSNDSATDPTTINQLPDLTIAKSHTGNFTQGQTGTTYTITATNSGFAATSGTVTVTDTLPTGLTATAISGTGWTCVLGTLTCTRSDALAASTSYPAITVTVNVANNAAASVTNSVSVSGGGQTNTANDTATDPTTINQLPDLTIAKSHSGNFAQGQVGATYSITVTNSGSAATSGTVTVTDTLPAGLTATAISGSGWSCVLGTLTCTRNDALAASSSYPLITLTVNVANNAASSVTNSVSVSGGGQTNTANDTATDPTTITQLADLTIVKSHSGNFTQGQTGATYSITVSNSGSAATSGTVTVTDTLPAGLTATGISGTGWTCVLGTLTCTRSDALAAGSSYPAITLTVTVANNAASSITNSVSVSGGGQTNTANDTATDPTTITQLADLTIAKSHSGNFTQGQTGATYSITATNSGAGATSGTVTVTDTLPAGLTATAIAGTGWTCVLGTLTCTRSNVLAAGASYPAITVTVNVANNAASSITNSVSVSGGGEIITTNDTATDPTTITQLPDLTIAKSHSGNFTQGQVGATYSITVTNSGNAATNGATVTVTDTLPAGLTATAISGTGWSCVLGTLTCTRSSVLAAGASYPAITLTVNVANNAAASVTNSVSVSGGGEIITTNDTATDPTTITQLADLTIIKSHSGNFTQGQTGATYSITATNSGSSATGGTVTVTDTLPAGLTATAIAGSGWSCVLGTLTCTRSDALAAGSSYPVITLTVTVANNAAASVTNSASVSGGGETNTGNNTANDPTTINQLPDLTVAKSHTGNFTQGQVGATYSISTTNSGSAATSGLVTVTDTLPAGLTATAISGTGWTCVLATLTCTRSDALAAGASYPVITLTVNVAMNAASSVTNSVAVSGGGETNTGNNSANDVTAIDAGPPIINLVKSVSPLGQQMPGTDLTYTIVYTNSGGKPASNFVITDPNMANADPLERVFHNLDFKIGSISSSPGTSGLVATFAYSNDGGVTWTYTPVSGGGGAPAGFDRNVTNIRWSFAGNLSQTSPNNTGSVSFVVRIR